MQARVERLPKATSPCGSTSARDAAGARGKAFCTSDRIVFAVDGKPFHTYTNKGTGVTTWPFDKPQYLLLNLAIGGEMAGWVDPAVLPRSFEVDDVRVYQKRWRIKDAEPARMPAPQLQI